MKIGFIGAGNLSEAIIRGIIKQNLINENEKIGIYDKNIKQIERFDEFNIADKIIKFSDIGAIIDYSDYIFLAVKPNNFDELLSEINELNLSLNSEKIINKIFISPAAGINIKFIESKLNKINNFGVIRCMPNTPIFAGCGMTALCKNEKVSDEDFENVCKIFTNLGEILIINEQMINNITAVNGSSPAYVYLFAQAMLEGACKLGFDEKEIYPAVLKSLEGALIMLKNANKPPQELIKAVASPNGTTEKALKTFEENDFKNIIISAMQACAKRADELTQEFCK